MILQEGLESIGNSCFHSTLIEEIISPKTVKFIGENIFGYYNNRITVIFQEGFENIDYKYFHDTEIKELVIPKSVRNFNPN